MSRCCRPFTTMIATEMQIVASSASVAMTHGIVMDEAVVSVAVTDPMRVARMDTDAHASPMCS